MELLDDKEEDVFAEATALVERAKVEWANGNDPLVFGFRASGALSIYFDAQRAYHFNPRNELRRIFLRGKLYKAEAGQLVQLEQRPQSAAIKLQNVSLSLEETSTILSEMNRRLIAIQNAVDTKQFRILGQIPAQVAIASRLRDAIPHLMQNRIASTPHTNG